MLKRKRKGRWPTQEPHREPCFQGDLDHGPRLSSKLHQSHFKTVCRQEALQIHAIFTYCYRYILPGSGHVPIPVHVMNHGCNRISELLQGCIVHVSVTSRTLHPNSKHHHVLIRKAYVIRRTGTRHTQLSHYSPVPQNLTQRSQHAGHPQRVKHLHQRMWGIACSESIWNL